MRLSDDQHRQIAEAFEEAATHPVLTPELRINYLYKARLARLSAKMAREQKLDGTPPPEPCTAARSRGARPNR
jgi:hypothetical protein